MSQANYTPRLRAHFRQRKGLVLEVKRRKYRHIADFELRRQRTLHEFLRAKQMEHGPCFGTARVNSMFGEYGEQLCFMEDYLLLLGFENGSPVSDLYPGGFNSAYTHMSFR